MKQKFEAIYVFKRLMPWLKKESEKHIKVLRSNRDGEYILTYFIEFCQSHGINKRQFYACYTPQQNQIDERKN